MRGIEARFHLENSAVSHEMTTLDHMIQWCKDRFAESQGNWAFPLEITYGGLRWLKAGILFEVKSLSETRDQIFSKQPVLAVSVIEAINSKISSIENMAESGQFNGMQPIPLAYGAVSVPPTTVKVVDSLGMNPKVQPLLLHVELMDSELRRRCGDLYEQFTSEPANQDRFDTVLREASTLLEDRIRNISGLSGNNYGLDLSLSSAASRRR